MDDRKEFSMSEKEDSSIRTTIMRAMGGLWGGNVDFIDKDGDIVSVEKADGFCVTHPDPKVREAIWKLSHDAEKQFYCDARRHDDILCFLNFIDEKDRTYLWLGAQRKLSVWMIEDCDQEQADAFVKATKTSYKNTYTEQQKKYFNEIMKKSNLN